MEIFRQGAIQPIRPIKLFDAAQTEDALRYMQRGQRTGKLVIQFPTDHSQLSASRGNNRHFDRTLLLADGWLGRTRPIHLDLDGQISCETLHLPIAKRRQRSG